MAQNPFATPHMLNLVSEAVSCTAILTGAYRLELKTAFENARTVLQTPETHPRQWPLLNAAVTRHLRRAEDDIHTQLNSLTSESIRDWVVLMHIKAVCATLRSALAARQPASPRR
jgi:hypothetical protein